VGSVRSAAARATARVTIVCGLALGFGVAGGACSSSAKPTTGGAGGAAVKPISAGQAPLRVELIRPAIAALESKLGGPQQYFEVNATPTLVNLFVAENNGTKAVAYVYAAGVLRDPAAPVDANGPTFAAKAISFDDATVLAKAVAQLPGSNFRLFSIAGANAAITVTVDSSQGTEFAIYVDGTGKILGTDQALTGPPESAPG